MTYSGAAGQMINIPLSEARSLQSQGIVEIVEDYQPEMAYETAKDAQLGKRTATIKAKK